MKGERKCSYLQRSNNIHENSHPHHICNQNYHHTLMNHNKYKKCIECESLYY